MTVIPVRGHEGSGMYASIIKNDEPGVLPPHQRVKGFIKHI